jgi:endonuclease/exonuclease/phosphatase family metal-dependent hydrolase
VAASVQAPARAEKQSSVLRVVSANVQEAFNTKPLPNDLDDMEDLEKWIHNFEQAPNRRAGEWDAGNISINDVFVFQEVTRKAAAFLAARLSKLGYFPGHYKVVAWPGKRVIRRAPGRFIVRDTAILINTKTMRLVRKGGLVRTGYPRRASSSDHVRVTKHPFVLLQRRATGEKVAVATVHFPPRKNLKSPRVSNIYRKRWSRKVWKGIDTTFPRRDDTVIAGDFNGVRCWRGTHDTCLKAGFWRLYRRDLGLDDFLWDHKRHTGVDYIFTSFGMKENWFGGVFKSRGSDHPVLWGEIVWDYWEPCGC